MESVARRRWIAIAGLTVLFAAAIGTMYALWAEFVPVFFYIALSAYAVGIALVFVFVRSRMEIGGMQGATRTTELPAGPPELPPTPDLPLVVEPSPSRPELLSPPMPAQAAQEGYTFRGHTLYQRGSGSKPIRFFSKRPGESGTPIALPVGFEAFWDDKKGRPALRALKESPLTETVEELETHVAGGDGKRCSAWTSIGIMCENPARDGSLYCARHVHYKPEQVTGQFEVTVPRGGHAGKAVRGGLGAFEVRVGGKPSGPKPLRIQPTEFEARVARPVVKGGRKALRMPEFEVQHDRRAMKPFKGVKAGEFEVSPARPAPKPLRLKEPSLVVRGPLRAPAKPLRLREPELRIRGGAAPATKPLRLREPILNVRSGAAPPVKPLRLREPNLNVRGPVAHAPKPLRLTEPNVVVRRGVGTPGKPLRLKEPRLEVRTGAAKPAKPLRNIADAPLEVKGSGSLMRGKPFRPAEPKLVVRSGASKPPKPFKSNPSDVLIERDSKERSEVGLGRPSKKPRRRAK